jgi:hypothetical protein
MERAQISLDVCVQLAGSSLAMSHVHAWLEHCRMASECDSHEIFAVLRVACLGTVLIHSVSALALLLKRSVRRHVSAEKVGHLHQRS